MMVRYTCNQCGKTLMGWALSVQIGRTGYNAVCDHCTKPLREWAREDLPTPAFMEQNEAETWDRETMAEARRALVHNLESVKRHGSLLVKQIRELDALLDDNGRKEDAQMFDNPLCCKSFNTTYKFGLIVDTPEEDRESVTQPYAIGDGKGHYAPLHYCPFCRANVTRDMQ